MKAALLTTLPADSLELVELEDPRPGPGDVVVGVRACGVCGTDLHIMAGESYRPSLPFTLGHEFVGEVEELGDGVEATWLGQRVVPTLFVGCGQCAACRAGDERLCERGARVTGVDGRGGGFATRAALSVSQLVAVPSALSDEVAASLVDAGATAHNAARLASQPFSYGERRRLVIGAGPLGLIAADLMRSLGLKVTVAEPNAQRRAVAAARGFEVTETVAVLERSYGAVVDCAGDGATVMGALDLLRPHGCYVCAGYADVPRFDLSVVSRRELVVRGVRSGTRFDLERILALVVSGDISPPPCQLWALEELNAAIDALRRGVVAGKAVILPAPRAGGSKADQKGEVLTHG